MAFWVFPRAPLLACISRWIIVEHDSRLKGAQPGNKFDSGVGLVWFFFFAILEITQLFYWSEEPRWSGKWEKGEKARAKLRDYAILSAETNRFDFSLFHLERGCRASAAAASEARIVYLYWLMSNPAASSVWMSISSISCCFDLG